MSQMPKYDPQTGQPLYPHLPSGDQAIPAFSYPQYQPGMQMHPGQALPMAMAYPGQPIPTQPMAPHAAPMPPHAAPMPSAPPYGFSPTPVSTVQWIATTSRNAAMLSDKAVVAGYEGHDGSPLWVIRAWHEGDLIPGKLAVKHNSAYVPWGGDEISVQNIEVCCAQPDTIRWVQGKDGVIPPKAISGGVTTTGEPLYIGRAKEQGSLTPGKVHPSHKAMYMSFGGKEVPHKTYEILCYA